MEKTSTSNKSKREWPGTTRSTNGSNRRKIANFMRAPKTKRVVRDADCGWMLVQSSRANFAEMRRVSGKDDLPQRTQRKMNQLKCAFIFFGSFSNTRTYEFRKRG